MGSTIEYDHRDSVIAYYTRWYQESISWTLDGMQYMPFQLLISVILTSRNNESCITFLISIENYVSYDFYECFLWNSKRNNTLYRILCAVLVHTLIVALIKLGLLPPRISFTQAL